MKKTLSLLLSLFLIIALLTGCSTPVPAPEPPPIQEQVTPVKPDSSTQEQSEAAEPDKESETEAPKPEAEAPKPETPTPTGQLKAHFINVGQGDSILIQTPTQNILIDAGDRGTTVVNYLKAQGISSLDLVIGTHPHADHIGGLINVLDTIPVKEVIDPGVVHTTKTFEDYLTLIDQKDIKFTEGRAGMVRDIGGGAKMEILHPVSLFFARPFSTKLQVIFP